MRNLKVIVEKHSDGYVAYPLGCKGIIVGEGDSYDEALTDVKSALKFHVESFGPDVFETDARRCLKYSSLRPGSPCDGEISGRRPKDQSHPGTGAARFPHDS